MLDIPSALQEQFEEYLRNKPIPNSSREAYKKMVALLPGLLQEP
jgi:hypothetical protein